MFFVAGCILVYLFISTEVLSSSILLLLYGVSHLELNFLPPPPPNPGVHLPWTGGKKAVRRTPTHASQYFSPCFHFPLAGPADWL
jgi:hypothetical protein